MRKKICILTGAGISKESGLPTYRGEDGLWLNSSRRSLLGLDTLRTNLAVVNDYFNEFRDKLRQVQPNAAHRALAELDSTHDVIIITQNIDDLHERAGSKNVLHIHGELTKARHLESGEVRDVGYEPITPEQQLRPHIVLFGEMTLGFGMADEALFNCDLFVSIGTSDSVVPAAGYIQKILRLGRPAVQVNSETTSSSHLFLHRILGPASETVPELVRKLRRNDFNFE